jgi:hypothetical protein
MEIEDVANSGLFGISGTNLRRGKNPFETVQMDMRKCVESSISFISLQVSLLQICC